MENYFSNRGYEICGLNYKVKTKYFFFLLIVNSLVRNYD